jgi:hypothetical protein
VRRWESSRDTYSRSVPKADRADVPDAIVRRLRKICGALPEVVEEEAWAGTRWCVRKKNFAHVVQIDAGWPPAYAKAAGSDGPLTVLTFRSAIAEFDANAFAEGPFFRPVWFRDIVGVALNKSTDWKAIAEFVTDSYCRLAPAGLAEQLHRPA